MNKLKMMLLLWLMPGKVEDVFTVLDKLILQLGPVEGRKMWYLLTALRGPDGREMDTVKHFTTGIIRSVLFPSLANIETMRTNKYTLLDREFKLPFAGWPTFTPVTDVNLTILREIMENGDVRRNAGQHFASHIKDAITSHRGLFVEMGLMKIENQQQNVSSNQEAVAG